MQVLSNIITYYYSVYCDDSNSLVRGQILFVFHTVRLSLVDLHICVGSYIIFVFLHFIYDVNEGPLKKVQYFRAPIPSEKKGKYFI